MGELNIDEKSDENWRRQSLLGVFFILVRQFWNTIFNLLPPIIAGSIAFLDKLTSYQIILAILALLIFYIVHAFLHYYFLMFRFEQNKVIFRVGIFQRQRKEIDYERIQSVNLKQNIIHRCFFLTGLEFDTAGSVSKEIQIDALNYDEAKALREKVLVFKSHHQSGSEIVEQGLHIDGENEICSARNNVENNIIIQAELIDLVKVGLSSNPFNWLILLSYPFYFLSEEGLENYIERVFENSISWNDSAQAVSLLVWLIVFIGLIMAVLLLAIIWTVIKHYGFELSQRSDGFHKAGGLLSRYEDNINFSKVQMIIWKTNPLRKWFRIASVYLFQAGSRELVAGAYYLPYCPAATVRDLSTGIFTEDNGSRVNLNKISWHYLIHKIVLLCVISALLLAFVSFLDGNREMYFFILALPVIFILIYLKYRRYRYGFDDEFIELHKGVIGETIYRFPIYKCQSATVKQSPYQRRRGLVNLNLHLASGTYTIPYIQFDQANLIRDYILYKVAFTDKKWF